MMLRQPDAATRGEQIDNPLRAVRRWRSWNSLVEVSILVVAELILGVFGGPGERVAARGAGLDKGL